MLKKICQSFFCILSQHTLLTVTKAVVFEWTVSLVLFYFLSALYYMKPVHLLPNF